MTEGLAVAYCFRPLLQMTEVTLIVDWLEECTPDPFVVQEVIEENRVWRPWWKELTQNAELCARGCFNVLGDHSVVWLLIVVVILLQRSPIADYRDLDT